MNDQALRHELDRVGQRYRSLWQSTGLAIAWTVLAIIGVAALVVAHRQGYGLPLWAPLTLAAVATVFAALLPLLLKQTRNPHWVARRLERQFPDLNARLLTALEQKPHPETRRLGYLQDTIVGEVVQHARTQRWHHVTTPWALGLARWGQRLALVALVVVCGAMIMGGLRGSTPSGDAAAAVGGAISVEPGDTSIERGTGLLVLARFNGPLPGDVRLLSKNKEGAVEIVQMAKSLDDPVFATRLSSVEHDLQYAVRYGDQETKWFNASVFEYPELKQADANLKFPGYTKLAEKRVEDVRSVTAVEGTKATLTLRLNKPVKQATLLPTSRPSANDPTPAAGPPIQLTPDPSQPDLYTATIDFKQSQTLRLQLTDGDGRQNKQPSAELAINVNANRPPELKPVTPGRDVDVSPIQELSTGVRVSDDFGVSRVGLAYSMAGGPPQDVVLASDVPAQEKRDVSQVLSLEQAKAEPDQLMSYYFWAEDFAADGSVRRTSGDMFFAEVRPFEEIFRQGQQPSAGEQQQQQQQQQSGNGQQAEELAELQKQVIAATWKIIRRETSATPSTAFVPDTKLVNESQASAKEQVNRLAERVRDARSRGFLNNVLRHMDRAIEALSAAADGPALSALPTALAAEQAAYQELLKLRAREFEVVQGQQQQGQQSQSESSSSSRRQQQLDQLQLDQEQNRYETQRTASPQQQENPEQRETRQVLNRLKELAQRQEDLNRQMQEMKSALEQARDTQQKEELQRQLARLRDQQQQQLRDTDELRDRMDRPENQERLAESRQQLEQTREDVRRASEQLEQGRVPEAATSGARASEQLNNLRDQVRRGAAGELAEAMTDLQRDARALDERQQQLSQQLKQLDSTEQRSLRESTERQQATQALNEQKQQLSRLTETMRKTVEETEATEPLVSKQLYDTLRQSTQQKTDQALDVSRQLLERGFTNEARQAEGEAAKGITQLRQGVEQAATGVLGDETESLRRARNELDQLAQELQREVDRNRPAGASVSAAGPATRPGDRSSVARANGPTTRDNRSADGSSGPTTRGSGRLAMGGPRQSAGERDPQQQRAGGNSPGDPTPDRQAGQQQSGQQQAGNGRTPSTQRSQSGGQGEQNRQANPSREQGQQGQQGQQGEQNQSGMPGGNQSQGGDGQQPGEQAGDQQIGGQPAQGHQQAGGQQPGQRGQGGQQPGGQQGAGQPGNQPGETQAGASSPSQPGGQRGSGQSPGQGQGAAQDDANSQQQPSDNAQAAEGGQPGGQPGSRPGQGRQPGLRGQNGAPGEPQPGEAQAPSEGDPQGERGQGRPGARAAGGRAGNPDQRGGGSSGPSDESNSGPLTGDDFRDWSDRLRDVEEMVSDPGLRDRAARIRERARDVRAELRRHSQQPNWNVVQETVGQPLAELRDAVAQELLRRDKPDALVPLDREAVPPQYAEQVRRYYERLGSGR
ncbi:MAG TPA: hypothetical protein VF595_12395 [Tepidisphaeraceae bacterium]|jgi:hypothetical protein